MHTTLIGLVFSHAKKALSKLPSPSAQKFSLISKGIFKQLISYSIDSLIIYLFYLITIICGKFSIIILSFTMISGRRQM